LIAVHITLQSSPPEQRKVRRIEALDGGPIFSSTPMLNQKEQPVVK
jgi:hypothetical protein